jgi:hypothetical protein
MSTPEFKKATMEPYSSKIPLVLLTFDNANWPEPLRVVGNTSNIFSNGEIYTAIGCTFTNVATGGDSAKVLIEDISQEIIATFRSYLGEVSAEAFIILAHNPDVVELGPWTFNIKDISIQGTNITMALSKESILRNSLGGTRVDEDSFPGLYI